MYDPTTDFETDTEELTPGQAHDRWESVTNLQADDLRGLKGDPHHEAYLETASEQRQTSDPPIAGGPLADAIHLAETPRSEWGPDERAEAEEAINFVSRHLEQFDSDAGEDLVAGPPRVHKREVALVRWGVDPDPSDGWP